MVTIRPSPRVTVVGARVPRGHEPEQHERPHRQRLGRRRGLGLGHRRHRPVDIAVAGEGDGPHLCDRVVLDLLAQGAWDIFTAAADWRCRADVGAGGHDGEVGRQGDEGARTGGPAAGRGDPDDDRHGRFEQCAHDVVGGLEGAARRIEPDDDRSGAIMRGGGDTLAQVASHDVIDDAGGRQDHDVGPLGTDCACHHASHAQGDDDAR